MASRSDCNYRLWTTFWSTIAKDGTRYRHQVRLEETKGKYQWMVRTEVWPSGDKIHHTNTIDVPESQGKHFFRVLRPQWSNVDEEGREMYPPEYQSGFLNLGERCAE